MDTKITEQDFLEYTIKAIVAHPEDVKLDRKVDEMGVLLTVDVHKEDIARIIGRKGQIANALRLILRAVAYNNNVRATLKINEPTPTLVT